MTFLGAAILSGLTLLPLAQRPISYGRDIRPILSENCFYCHGQDPNQRKADIRLDTKEGQRSGGIVVPGKPGESALVERIHHTEASKLMPPPKSNRKLSAEQKALLERWIAEGARFEDHWAFVAPVRPPVPKIGGISHPIDAFLARKMAEKGITPNPEADKRTLIRRLSLDLIGLPPKPEEVEAFVNDKDPKAYEKLVDRLMASPHYGERMALPWLDAARYADSNGFQQDGDTFQWVWRDWVVKAINDNMPFDRFTIEQLAGDLLPKATPEQKVASAFNRNHLVNGEGGAIPDEQRHVIYFDRIDVTATNWLGLTMACSQCHDHKYDPITAKDYYSFMAAFNQLSESGTAGYQSSKTRVSPPFLEYPLPGQKEAIASMEKEIGTIRAELDQKRKEWEKKVALDDKFADKAIREQILAKEAKVDPKKDEKKKEEKKDAKTEEKKKADREAAIVKYFEEKVEPALANKLKDVQNRLNRFRTDELPKVMVMADDKPRETYVLNRGEYLKPGEKVSFATPAFLPPLPKDAPKTRLGVAQWLVAPEHPLTSRVAINRIWQNLFGRGLVKTAEDFGVQGDIPENPELLDWLAVEFREKNWDMKRMHKLLLTSAAYKRTSKVTPAQLAADPENKYLARFPRVRLPALILRDVALATSGLLDERVGGKPVYPYQPDGIWETLAITKERDFTYPASTGNDLYRRSLYTFWRRTVGPANMFDASNRQNCRVRAGSTNTPLHALTTLNDPTWNEAARVLAAKLIRTEADQSARLDRIYELVLSRRPTEPERKVLLRILDQQRAEFASDKAAAKKTISIGAAPREDKLDAVELASWTEMCLAVYNLDEALTRE
jgi:hypothetical protein